VRCSSDRPPASRIASHRIASHRTTNFTLVSVFQTLAIELLPLGASVFEMSRRPSAFILGNEHIGRRNSAAEWTVLNAFSTRKPGRCSRTTHKRRLESHRVSWRNANDTLHRDAMSNGHVSYARKSTPWTCPLLRSVIPDAQSTAILSHRPPRAVPVDSVSD
jgi:hypothetical protein